MSSKAEKITAMLAGAQSEGIDPYYAGYFAYFNRGLFYEAHDVLEQLWLPQRASGNGLFYKGLIQLAGAFVHLQKNRPGPAAALFKLARKNLIPYPAEHESLDLPEVLAMIERWLEMLEAGDANPLTAGTHPLLTLRKATCVKANTFLDKASE
jgi:predicted metal-dependent hydrolase